MFIIEEELKKLPGKPGVYIMHGNKTTSIPITIIPIPIIKTLLLEIMP